MYPNWTTNALVVLSTLLSVSAAVLVHYEGLILISRRLGVHHDRYPRRKVLYGILGVLSLHVVEIWIFGFTTWALLYFAHAGSVSGGQALSLLDAVYMAATTFTTVGFGDLAPVGPIRFLAGTMALTGFVLITWSASFTYLEMERFWRR